MRIEASLLIVLVLTAWGQGLSAQQAGQEPAQEERASGGKDAAQGEDTPSGQDGGKKADRAPTRFVPRETISPDSVIAFPADI